VVGWATGLSLPTNYGQEWWANKRTFAHPTWLKRVKRSDGVNCKDNVIMIDTFDK